MKTNKKIAVGFSILAFSAFVMKKKQKLQHDKSTLSVSNEGYESALDLLKPTFKNNSNKYHVGPVLPHHTFS